MRVSLLLPLLILAGGCQSLFPTEAGEALAHFEDAAPARGAAIDALGNAGLVTLDGEQIALSDLHRGRPMVVRLGSLSCPVYRYRRFDFRKLRARYADRVDFVVIYTQEAHPNGTISPYADEEWVPWINRLARVQVPAHGTLTERRERAGDTRTRFSSTAHYLVDDMRNGNWSTFGEAPAPAFVFDAEGELVLRQPWVEPKALTSVLDALLDIGAQPNELSAGQPGTMQKRLNVSSHAVPDGSDREDDRQPGPARSRP